MPASTAAALGQHVTQSGFFDDRQRVGAGVAPGRRALRQGHLRPYRGDLHRPDGKTVDDPAFRKKILDNLAQVEKDHPDQIIRSIGYFKTPDVLRNMADASKQHAFMSIQLKGDNDDLILKNFKAGPERPGRSRAST